MNGEGEGEGEGSEGVNCGGDGECVYIGFSKYQRGARGVGEGHVELAGV